MAKKIVRASSAERATINLLQGHYECPVELHDDQSQRGMFDLEIRHVGGRWGAVEVTAAEDQRMASDAAAARSKPPLHDGRLEHEWFVVLQEGASVNKARKLIVDVLLQLEQAQLLNATNGGSGPWDEHAEREWAAELLADVGVQGVMGGKVYSAGTVVVSPALRTDFLSRDPDDVVTFIEDFCASRPEDVQKLARSGADERHLFIWGGAYSTGWRPLRALGADVDRLPERAPILPYPLTHVWLAAEWERPSRIVMWTAGAGWSQVGTIA